MTNVLSTFTLPAVELADFVAASEYQVIIHCEDSDKTVNITGAVEESAVRPGFIVVDTDAGKVYLDACQDVQVSEVED